MFDINFAGFKQAADLGILDAPGVDQSLGIVAINTLPLFVTEGIDGGDGQTIADGIEFVAHPCNKSASSSGRLLNSFLTFGPPFDGGIYKPLQPVALGYCVVLSFDQLHPILAHGTVIAALFDRRKIVIDGESNSRNDGSDDQGFYPQRNNHCASFASMYALKTAVCRYVIGAVTAAIIAAASRPLVKAVVLA